MKLGIIFCEDNQYQRLWTDAFELIFNEFGIKPDIITEPEKAREGHIYIWRPSANNFDGKFKNSSLLSEKLAELATEFERKGALVFPNSENLSFYENKIKIFEYVKQNNIKAPQTFHFKTLSEALAMKNRLPYPVLLKHAYSCNSFGLDKAEDTIEFEAKAIKLGSEISNYIIQRKLNILRDYRINYVANQTIIAYARIFAKGAISSASRYKSRIDHFSVPFHSHEYAYSIGEKFNAPFGGIDFAWEKGDNIYTAEPYLLEISPMFDLNPMPLKPIENWSRFKNSWRWKKYYNQAILHAAYLQVSFIISKFHNSKYQDKVWKNLALKKHG